MSGRLESGAHEASRRTAPNRPCPAPQVVRRTWALRRGSRDYRDPGCARWCGRARCGASSPSRLFVIVTIAMAKRPTKPRQPRGHSWSSSQPSQYGCPASVPSAAARFRACRRVGESTISALTRRSCDDEQEPRGAFTVRSTDYRFLF
jgi:hypothetical protein